MMKFCMLLAMAIADPGVTTHVLDTTLGLPGKVKVEMCSVKLFIGCQSERLSPESKPATRR